MSLMSINFLIFVGVVFILYYLFPWKKYQWVILLLASYFYYIFTCNQYVVYLLVTTLTTYGGALLIERIADSCSSTLKSHKGDWEKPQRKAYKNRMNGYRRTILILVLVLNFGILSFLKYFDFLAGSIDSLLGQLGLAFPMPSLNLVLPLGISFYTFQSMGYLIDVYRNKFPAEKNVAKFALFVSFFPQIVQGPIAFYSDLAHQLYEKHSFRYESFKSGGLLILWGVLKKLVIADRAVQMINLVTKQYQDFSGSFILRAALMYALQLYADFSGGIDVCRGIGEILGITMAENFRRPYFSKTLTEYWHRWHITLGEWLRTYLFYPISISKSFLKMGKNLKKHGLRHLGRVLPTGIASLITFIIIGIWHGAAWKYVAFGVWNGGVILFSALMQPISDNMLTRLHIRKESWPYMIFSMARTFLLVLIGYYFDIAVNFKAAMIMLWRSVADFSLRDFSDFSCLMDSSLTGKDYLVIIFGCLVIFIISLIQEKTGRSVREQLSEKSILIQWPLYILLILMIVILGVYGPGSNPAEFVYMQF